MGPFVPLCGHRWVPGGGACAKGAWGAGGCWGGREGALYKGGGGGEAIVFGEKEGTTTGA